VVEPAVLASVVRDLTRMLYTCIVTVTVCAGDKDRSTSRQADSYEVTSINLVEISASNGGS
jgi:hypothetical protein